MAETEDRSLLSRARMLVSTLDEMTALMATLRQQQLEQEAYATVTRLALGALLRAAPEEARARVVARLSEPAEVLLGPETPPDSPLGRAVLDEAARMAAALTNPPPPTSPSPAFAGGSTPKASDAEVAAASPPLTKAGGVGASTAQPA